MWAGSHADLDHAAAKSGPAFRCEFTVFMHTSVQDKLPNRAVVAESVVALVTRKGNPKNIRGWDDLIRCCIAELVQNLALTSS